MTTATEVMCPKCGGKTWDNRETKRNPKAPDYKCRDKACDGAVWPPRDGSAPRAAAPSNVKAPHSSGGPLPWERSETDAEHPPMAHERLDKMFALYDLCLSHAHAAAVERFGKDVTDEAVAAMAATLYIQANNKGIGA